MIFLLCFLIVVRFAVGEQSTQHEPKNLVDLDCKSKTALLQNRYCADVSISLSKNLIQVSFEINKSKIRCFSQKQADRKQQWYFLCLV